MMVVAGRWQLNELLRRVVIPVAIVLALAIGLLVAKNTLNEKIAVTAIAGIACLFVLLQGRRAYWTLFCAGVATIALGHRGIYTDAETYFVPLQVIVWVLWAILLVESIARREKLSLKIPLTLTFITIWGLLNGLAYIITTPPDQADEIVAWMSPFLFGWAAFFVVGKFFKTDSQVARILTIMMWATAAMSVLAIIEYFFPSVAHLLPGVFTKASFLAQDGFQRAQFSFWGYPAAASLISWGAFITFDFIIHAKSPRIFVIGLAIFAVDLIAIFISGQRSSWIALPIGLIILNLDGKIRTAVITIALMLVALVFVPPSLWKRLDTISNIVGGGKIVDTSSQQRLDRWQSGLDVISKDPLTGGGYGGWLLHDAFLEIGAHLGVIPMVVFVIFLIQVIINILITRGIATPEARRYSLVFMALAVPWIIQMTVETDLQTPPFAAAQWVFLAIAWYLPDIFRNSAEVQTEAINEPIMPQALMLKEPYL
jgi:hypothetical protein